MKTNLDYLNLVQLGTGARIIAALRMRKPAAELGGPPELRSAIEAALVHDKALFEREMLHRSQRGQRAEHGDGATDLDRRLDALLATIDAGLEVQMRLAETAPQRAELARAMRAELFPEGLGGLTQKRYVEQALATETLIERYHENPAYQSLAQSAGLEEAFDALAELNAAYTAALNSAEKPPSFEELKAARDEGHRRLGEIVSRVLGRFPTESEEDRAARHALLDPIERQAERIRADYRARRRRGDNAPESEAA